MPKESGWFNRKEEMEEQLTGKINTHGIGMNRTEQQAKMVLPQSTPKFLNKGVETTGIAAPIIDRTKSLEANEDAA